MHSIIVLLSFVLSKNTNPADMKKPVFTFRMLTVWLLVSVLVLGLLHQYRKGYSESSSTDPVGQDNTSIVTLVKIF